jgi:hypothetical protein
MMGYESYSTTLSCILISYQLINWYEISMHERQSTMGILKEVGKIALKVGASIVIGEVAHDLVDGVFDAFDVPDVDTSSYDTSSYYTGDTGTSSYSPSGELLFGAQSGDYVHGYTYSPSTGLYYDSDWNYTHNGPGSTFDELVKEGKASYDD